VFENGKEEQPRVLLLGRQWESKNRRHLGLDKRSWSLQDYERWVQDESKVAKRPIL